MILKAVNGSACCHNSPWQPLVTFLVLHVSFKVRNADLGKVFLVWTDHVTTTKISAGKWFHWDAAPASLGLGQLVPIAPWTSPEQGLSGLETCRCTTLYPLLSHNALFCVIISLDWYYNFCYVKYCRFKTRIFVFHAESITWNFRWSITEY